MSRIRAGTISRLKLARRSLGQAIRKFSGRVAPPPGGGTRLFLPRTGFDYKRAVGDGSLSSTVMACVNFKARSWTEAPLVVEVLESIEGHDTWVRHDVHPALNLLHYPNPAYSGELLWMATIADFNLSGNGYWWIGRNIADEPVQLWWIPSTIIEPAWEKGGPDFVTHYNYRPDPAKKPIPLPVRDVVHFRYGLNAFTRKGVSPLESVYREIFTDEEAANFVAAILKNLGIPGLIISPDGGPDDEFDQARAETIKEMFRDRFGGDRRGDPLIMGAPVKIQQLSFSPDQLQFREIRKISEERVSGALGVPAIVAGLGAGLDRSTYANYEAAKEAAWESTLAAEMRLVAADLSAQFATNYARPRADGTRTLRFAFDLDQVRVLQPDREAEARSWDTRVQGGWAMVSEAREAVGLPVDESHRIFLRRIGVIEVPAGQAGNQAGNQAGQDEPSPDDDPEQVNLSVARRLAMSTALTKASAADRRWIRAQHLLWDQFTRAWAADLADALDGLADEVVEALGLNTKTAALEDWPRDLRLGLDDPRIIEALLPPAQGERWFLPVYEAHWALVAETMFAEVSQQLGVAVAWSLDDPVARELIAQGGTRLGLVDLDAQTRQAVFDALAAGQEAGDGVPELARRIRDAVRGEHMYPGIAERRGVNAARTYRAETIARTEAKYAQNVSTIRAYVRSDVVEALRVFDGADCGWTGHDDPDLADGTIRSFRDAEQYPLAHPRCVRSFAPVVKEGR